MFNNVLVGVDGRPTGRDAIALASRLIDPDGKLTLAHVHSGPTHPAHALAPDLLRQEREASAKLLERERADADLDAELISVAGTSPGRALHMQAKDQHADLLVVGSCSRGVLGRTLLGDDTRGALNGAPCAVAIASLGYAEHPMPLAKIGVGYDGSPESRLALQVARETAHATRARVEALEVVGLPTYGYLGIGPFLGEGLDAMLEEADDRMKELPDVHGRAICGVAGEELAAFAEKLDLLVVGSRGHGPMKRMMLGSTSGYLERHSRCSLLVLPRRLVAKAIDEGQHPGLESTHQPTTAHSGVL